MAVSSGTPDDGLREKLVALVCDNLRVKPEQVTDGITFQELGADSLDIAELIMAIEEELQVTIPDDQAENLKTFGDLLNYVRQHKKAG
jgi:acyl carrier protein